MCQSKCDDCEESSFQGKGVFRGESIPNKFGKIVGLVILGVGGLSYFTLWLLPGRLAGVPSTPRIITTVTGCFHQIIPCLRPYGLEDCDCYPWYHIYLDANNGTILSKKQQSNSLLAFKATINDFPRRSVRSFGSSLWLLFAHATPNT